MKVLQSLLLGAISTIVITGLFYKCIPLNVALISMLPAFFIWSCCANIILKKRYKNKEDKEILVMFVSAMVLIYSVILGKFYIFAEPEWFRGVMFVICLVALVVFMICFVKAETKIVKNSEKQD